MQTTIPPGFKVTEEQFIKLAAAEDTNRLERTADGELIVMPPTGSDTGRRNINLSAQVFNWNAQAGKPGVVFDSSTGFKLSNGATRSPDVSWIESSRWNSLTQEQQQGFAPIDPDFVIELMSRSDKLETTQAKMKEYISCGVKFGWLINPDAKQVEIYKADGSIDMLDNPQVVSGGDLLLGLEVNLKGIF